MFGRIKRFHRRQESQDRREETANINVKILSIISHLLRDIIYQNSRPRGNAEGEQNTLDIFIIISQQTYYSACTAMYYYIYIMYTENSNAIFGLANTALLPRRTDMAGCVVHKHIYTPKNTTITHAEPLIQNVIILSDAQNTHIHIYLYI